MATIERSTVVGAFTDRVQAEQAINELRHAGFSDDEIGFILRASSEEESTAQGETESGTGTGTAAGIVSGGVVGGILGAAAALLIPGFGPAIAGGILAATLGGAAIGAAAGGIIGALTGLGVPEEEARYYQSEFEAGRTIVTVKAASRYQEALDILRTNGAYDASTRPRLDDSSIQTGTDS